MRLTPYREDTDFSQPLSFEDKTTIFSEQTDGWQLLMADLVINGGVGLDGDAVKPIPGSGFAALYICLSYFELIAKYEAGFAKAGLSRAYFKKGVYTVFPPLQDPSIPRDVADTLLDLLYEEARCGLYHGGITGPRVVLTGDITTPMMFELQPPRLVINPHLLVPVLRRNLKWYVERLRDITETNLRTNFERRFDFDHHNP